MEIAASVNRCWSVDIRSENLYRILENDGWAKGVE